MRVCVLFLYCFFLSDVTDVFKNVPDKLKVLDLLANLSASWEIIGIALGVDDNTLDSIGHSNDLDPLNLTV